MSQLSQTRLSQGIALVCLGSNATSRVGGPLETLRAAIECLAEGPMEIRAQSRFYVSPFLPAGTEPDVINAVVAVETNMSPDDLLSYLHTIEASFDRQRLKRWTSRTLDLDLLTMDQKILPDQSTLREWVNLGLDEQKLDAPTELILPHPRIQDRAFVLVPAIEIAPDWRHPLLGLTMREMLEALPEADRNAIRPVEG